jgi:uncharacterized membrane protein (TIGR02234 family)
MAERAAGRRTFGPVVLLGLAGAGLGAVAGHERWVSGTACTPGTAATFAEAAGDAGQAPAAGAAALALLAAWGVLLVTRGKVRRVVAVVAALAALGMAAATALGPRTATGAVQDYLENFGVDCVDTSLTGWFYAAVVGAVLALVPALLAVRHVGSWPEMGRRYDAPAGESAKPTVPPEEQGNLELWKAMDEGHDPTA